MARAKYWREVARETGFIEVKTLKACIPLEGWNKLKETGLRDNQRKLTPKQLAIIYSYVGEPSEHIPHP